ncbi:MAG: tRNA (N6-isopentenyl adenosine(37)-C2)-methylthiotransferase MiaB, partial [Dehalococcoidia bacterium]
WTVGCQMNEADSERLASALDQLGCTPSPRIDDADIIVLNSCVVRQGVEAKVAGRLDSLKSLKKARPGRVITLMGCMVGPEPDGLKSRFPHVDLLMRPQVYNPLLNLVAQRQGVCLDNVGPLIPSHPKVSTRIPIIHGCDKFCTFCIIPYRRGRERSRPVEELTAEVRALALRGVKEVTLLGQNVDSYGHDLPDRPDLADLLTELTKIEGIQRIRFLTSHPNDMSQKLIDAVAELDKVCEHINLPVQAGDDEILRIMRRGYTTHHYRELVARIRATIPDVSMSTDLIVGFADETEEQFQRTVDLLEEIRFDKVHVAPYSVRPGTIAYRKIPDDLDHDEKMRRLHVIEELQARIAGEINSDLAGTTQQVLVEGRRKGKWQGRTPANKLVFFSDDGDWQGQMVDVKIEHTTAWSLRGSLAEVYAGSAAG